ncbi:hypothetical protein MHTCC0001_33470 [Flavobacteriaceae bacterium MHTCC 0001]
MKKIGLIVLGFIIGAVLTYYFCPRPGVDEMHAMKPNIKPPKDTISIAQARKLFNNWKDKKAKVDSLVTSKIAAEDLNKLNAIKEKVKNKVEDKIKDKEKKKRITNVSWPLEEIRQYLDYAEAAADSLGYDMTEVAIYYGNYGKKAKPSKRNKNTLFIVPRGNRKLSKGSVLNLSLQSSNNIPAFVLNDGNGGDGDF